MGMSYNYERNSEPEPDGACGILLAFIVIAILAYLASSDTGEYVLQHKRYFGAGLTAILSITFLACRTDEKYWTDAPFEKTMSGLWAFIFGLATFAILTTPTT